MKQFILTVEKEGCTHCGDCPFYLNKNHKHICDYLTENAICNHYDFDQINIEEYNERH